MPKAFTPYTWQEAQKDFLTHIQAVRAPKTVRFYEVQLNNLVRWVEPQNISLDHFGKRHLDSFLVFRQEKGISQTTLHHDAIAAKVFLKWCVKNDIIERSLLADYEVRAAPTPPKYMPSEEDMQSLVSAVQSYYSPLSHPDIRFIHASKRAFHRERNFAIVLSLLDSACRIGEVLSLKVGDFQKAEGKRGTYWQIMIRESKGRTARMIPLSEPSSQAIQSWLKVRARVMSDIPKERDPGYLFLSEIGGKIDESKFLTLLKRYLKFAGLGERITLHSLRRFSLNRLAKTSLAAAQDIAGHKDPKTTRIYTKLDSEFLLEVHTQANVVKSILTRKEVVSTKRIL